MLSTAPLSVLVYLLAGLHEAVTDTRTVYLDSYKTCNQHDYLVKPDRSYRVTGDRRPEVQSRVFIKCHMTFKADNHHSRVCFTMATFSPDIACRMFLVFYDGDETSSGKGAVFNCKSQYLFPWTWCSGGQYAMILLDRDGGRSSVREMTVEILVHHSPNPRRTVYLDSGCDNTELMEHSTVYVHNRHVNGSREPPRRCEFIFDYIGKKEYPVCVTMTLNQTVLSGLRSTCPFRLTVWEDKSTSGATLIDEWTCDKTSPAEICSQGPILSLAVERLTYGSTHDPAGLFQLVVQDRSPAPPPKVSVTAVVLGTLGGLVVLVLLYFLLAAYLDNKKGIYIGPCCLCRKYCNKYKDDSVLSTNTGFTSVATRNIGDGQL